MPVNNESEMQRIWDEIIEGKRYFPMQPGETSWASWKCDGGPHRDDSEPLSPVAPAVEAAEIDDSEVVDDESLAISSMLKAIKDDPSAYSPQEIIDADQAAREQGVPGIISPSSYTGADFFVVPRPQPVNSNWTDLPA